MTKRAVLRRLVLTVSIGAGILHAASPGVLAQARAQAAQQGDSILRKSAHATLVCVACHTSLDPQSLATAKTVAPVNCLRCHADAQFTHDFHPDVARAIRAEQAPRVACKDCHGAHDVASPRTPGSKFSGSHVVESCGQCHKRAAEAFPGSAHGAAFADGAKGAPTCLTCHRARITAMGQSADTVSLKTEQARLCLTCHQDTPDVRAKTSPNAGFISRWDSGAHGAALKHGEPRAANCVACHGSHDIRKAADPASRVNPLTVSTTCASCHAKEHQEFSVSVHGLAKSHAQADSLACTSCHGEHPKAAAPGAQPSVPTDSASAQVCTMCHAPVVLSGKYRLASDRFLTFADTYHALTLHGDAVQASNCASCHGAHDVRKADDSTSSVHEAGRAATCGKCHQNAIARFSAGPVHDKSSAVVVALRPVSGRFVIAALLLIAALAGGAIFYRTTRRTAQA